MTAPVRALVVDDSTTARALMVAILSADPDIDVVGEAATGAEALRQLHVLHPTVVIMDIEMPDMDGFEVSKRIMAEVPTPIIIVTASQNPRDVALSLQATRVGALTVQPKPHGPTAHTHARESRRLADLVKALADVKVVRRRRRPDPLPPPPVADQPQGQVAIIGVAASTGGPAALYRLLAALRPSAGVPVLVVQHIAPGFIEGLIRWLNTATPMQVMLAVHGARLHPDVVYVAPDGVHLQVTRTRHIDLDDSAAVRGFRPSASALFTSLAVTYGGAAAAVVLTGMGDDGLEGARALRSRGGVVLAQNEQTSTVFGMPRAVIDAGLADHVGPVEELSLRLSSMVQVPTTGDAEERS